MLPYVKFAQFRNAMFTTLNGVLIMLPYVKLSLISKRDVHYTKLFVLIILPYVNFTQFRNALRGTLKYVSYYFAL